jgi:hypothetical protein
MLFVLLLTYLLIVLGDKSFDYTKYKIRGMFGKGKHTKFSMLCPNNLHITVYMSITFLEDCQ